MTKEEKLKQLKEDIGEELYNQLTPEQRELIIETEGSLDLGRKYTEEDFKRMRAEKNELEQLNKKLFQASDDSYALYNDMRELLMDLCNENSKFHKENPISLKEAICTASINKIMREILESEKQKYLLEKADELLGRLMDKVEEIEQKPSDYYQNPDILLANQWMKYYHNEIQSKEDEEQIIDDLNYL